MRIFVLIFDVNTIRIRKKNWTNLAHEYFRNIFLARQEIWVVYPWFRETLNTKFGVAKLITQNASL